MKEKIIVFFYPREDTALAKQVLNAIGRLDLFIEQKNDEGFIPYSFEFMGRKNHQLLILINALKQYATPEQWDEKIERIYTDEELRQFTLLVFRINRKEIGYGGPTYGTRYDLSTGCKRCGSGAKQISNLLLKPSELPKKGGSIFRTLHGEIIVSPNLKDIFTREKVTGSEFRSVCDYRNPQKELGLFQIIVNNQLPKFKQSSLVSIDERQCPECRRDSYFPYSTRFPTELRYNKIDVKKIEDFNCTYELNGRSVLREPVKNSHFATPWILVPPKILNIVRRENIKHVEFEPVFFF